MPLVPPGLNKGARATNNSPKESLQSSRQSPIDEIGELEEVLMDTTPTTRSAPDRDLDFVTPWAAEPDAVIVDLTQPGSIGLVIELRQALTRIDSLAAEVQSLRDQLERSD